MATSGFNGCTPREHSLGRVKVTYSLKQLHGCKYHWCIGDILYGDNKNQIHWRACQSVLRIMDCYILFLCHISSRIGHPSRMLHIGHIYACAAGTRTWNQLARCPIWTGTRLFGNLLVLMTDVISEASGEHVHLRNLVRVSLLTNIKFEVDEDSDQIKF